MPKRSELLKAMTDYYQGSDRLHLGPRDIAWKLSRGSPDQSEVHLKTEIALYPETNRLGNAIDSALVLAAVSSPRDAARIRRRKSARAKKTD